MLHPIKNKASVFEFILPNKKRIIAKSGTTWQTSAMNWEAKANTVTE